MNCIFYSFNVKPQTYLHTYYAFFTFIYKTTIPLILVKNFFRWYFHSRSLDVTVAFDPAASSNVPKWPPADPLEVLMCPCVCLSGCLLHMRKQLNLFSSLKSDWFPPRLMPQLEPCDNFKTPQVSDLHGQCCWLVSFANVLRSWLKTSSKLNFSVSREPF